MVSSSIMARVLGERVVGSLIGKGRTYDVEDVDGQHAQSDDGVGGESTMGWE